MSKLAFSEFKICNVHGIGLENYDEGEMMFGFHASRSKDPRGKLTIILCVDTGC